MFCTKCGAKVPEGAAFCASCGAPQGRQQDISVAPAPTMAPVRMAAEMGNDLKASLEARRELGPDMEDHLVEAFLTRLDGEIKTRVDEQVARRAPAQKLAGQGVSGSGMEPVLVVCGSMGIAIPLMAVAHGGAASIPVMIGVVLINMFYFIFRHQ